VDLEYIDISCLTGENLRFVNIYIMCYSFKCQLKRSIKENYLPKVRKCVVAIVTWLTAT
jgi:hypothetical protein